MTGAPAANRQKLPNPLEAINRTTLQYFHAADPDALHQLLDTQDDRLNASERLLVDWLQRRRALAADTRKLLGDLQASEDAGELLHAQHDWLGAAMRCWAADCAAWVLLGQQWMGLSQQEGAPAGHRAEPASAEPRKTPLDKILKTRATPPSETASVEAEMHH